MPDMARHVKRIRRIHVAWRPTWVGTTDKPSISFSLECCLQGSISRTYVSFRPLSRSFSLFFGVRTAAIAENGGIYERVEGRDMWCRRIRVALCATVNVDITSNCTYVAYGRKFRRKYMMCGRCGCYRGTLYTRKYRYRCINVLV